MKIIHLSDIHFWQIAFSPRDVFSKRIVGTASLLLGRGRRFRLERWNDVITRIQRISPDHVIITGDLTTTASVDEFNAARNGLMPLLIRPGKLTVVPGNHDRYTGEAVRGRRFESAFEEVLPEREFPWIRKLDDETAILGLDATRSDLTAQGFMPPRQLSAAKALIPSAADRPRRLLVASHYPLTAPPLYYWELVNKRLVNAEELGRWLATIGPHLYLCGHVHVSWAFQPPDVPNQMCLNSGAPLLRDPIGYRPPGFLEIDLNGDGVQVQHHGWSGHEWTVKPLWSDPIFFGGEPPDPD